jgi:OmpA-OmpF porin, OOP family
MKRILVAGIVAGGLVLGGFASAAEEPGQWYFSPMASVIWVDDNRLVDDDVGAALAIGRAFSDAWNVEFHSFGYQLDGFDDTDYWGVGVDFMRVYYRSGRISPYLLGGGGWNVHNRQFGLRPQELLFQCCIRPVLTDLVPGGSAALRTELRYRFDGESPSAKDLMLNIGLQIPFGSPYAQPAPPPPATAATGPGRTAAGRLRRRRRPGQPGPVPGHAAGRRGGRARLPAGFRRRRRAGLPRDQCPDTPSGSRVDSRGCPIEDVIALEGVTFAFNSDQITADERGTLNEAVDILKSLPRGQSRGRRSHGLRGRGRLQPGAVRAPGPRRAGVPRSRGNRPRPDDGARLRRSRADRGQLHRRGPRPEPARRTAYSELAGKSRCSSRGKARWETAGPCIRIFTGGGAARRQPRGSLPAL